MAKILQKNSTNIYFTCVLTEIHAAKEFFFPLRTEPHAVINESVKFVTFFLHIFLFEYPRLRRQKYSFFNFHRFY